MIKKVPGSLAPSGQSSVAIKSNPTKFAVGSGSRPVTGKTETKSSAPPDMHTLGRAPGGWLR